MGYRTIILDTDEKIRKISRPVEKFDSRLFALLDDMKETLEREEGVGLAAVQVAILRRLFIISTPELFLEIINPKIIKSSGEQIDIEACLSVDRDKACKVKRPQIITFEYNDRHGKAQTKTLEGFEARVFCHEYDHLDGILFTDRRYEDNENSVSSKSKVRAANIKHTNK